MILLIFNEILFEKIESIVHIKQTDDFKYTNSIKKYCNPYFVHTIFLEKIDCLYNNFQLVK